MTTKYVTETRTNYRPLSEGDRKRQEEILVNSPAHSLAVMFSLIAIVIGAIVLTLIYKSRRYEYPLDSDFYSYAAIGMVIMIAVVYEIVYHGARYQLTNELRKAETRPHSETIIETIIEEPEAVPVDEPAPTATINHNLMNDLPRHASGRFADNYQFTGVQIEWFRRNILKGDYYIRRDTSPAGVGWTDMEKGCPGSGTTKTDRRNHFTTSCRHLRKAGYITEAGKWTVLAFEEFLQLPLPAHYK